MGRGVQCIARLKKKIVVTVRPLKNFVQRARIVHRGRNAGTVKFTKRNAACIHSTESGRMQFVKMSLFSLCVSNEVYLF
jgi:hypothetical protein